MKEYLFYVYMQFIHAVYATIQHNIFSKECSSESFKEWKAECFRLTL